MVTSFDYTKIYHNELEEKIDEIVKICNRDKIPMFLSFCVKNNEESSDYENFMVGAYANNLILKDDMIPRFVNVLNGFDTVPKKEIMEMDFDTDDSFM